MIWRVIRYPASTPISPKQLRQGSYRSYTMRIFDPNIARLVASPPKNPEDTLTAVGWIRTVRKQKRVTFVELGDGSTPHNLQAVLKPSQSEGYAASKADRLYLWTDRPK